MSPFPYTPEQQAVIEHPGGHAKVAAVAGSGKTATLVARVLRLLERGVDPRRIVVLMFNVDAQRQFSARLAAAAGPRPVPEVRTFHSMGYRLVQRFTARGLLPPRRLETAEGIAARLAREALHATWQARGDEAPAKTLEEEFVGFIGLVKANGEPPEQVFAAYGFAEQSGGLIEAFARFEDYRVRHGLRFYSDLLCEPLQRIREDPAVAAWVANRVDHILVDEYQDVNAVQDALVRAITGERAEVMVVGDVDQCIYEWRGARPEFLAETFERRHAPVTRYTLSRGFRYGHRLALAAGHAIRHNRHRDDTLCLAAPGNPDTELQVLAQHVRAPHPAVEAIRVWRDAGRRLDQAAVLVRQFSASIPIELALLGAGIPYRLLGRAPVFDSPEVRALLGVLELAAGRLQEQPPAARRATVEALLRLPPLGLKQPLLERLGRRIAADPRQAPTLLEAVAAELPNPRHGDKLRRRARLWRMLAAGELREAGPGFVLRHYSAESELPGGVHFMSARVEDAENTLAACDAVEEFADGVGGTLTEFLDRVAELRASAGQMTADDDVLLITSIHRAKGLEWPLVLVADLKEGRFPRPEADLEAERRLFYVAITRARERLVLLRPADAPETSRFVQEAEVELSDRLGAMLAAGGAGELPCDSVLAQRYVAALDAPVRLTPTTDTAAAPAPGVLVEHPLFGRGVVRSLSADGNQAQVDFAAHGSKWLVLQYARLRPV